MDMTTIKQRNRDAGLYWFEPDTLRFFNSRIPRSTVDGSSYFVSSEQREWDTPRLYTIRRANTTGSIDTNRRVSRLRDSRCGGRSGSAHPQGRTRHRLAGSLCERRNRR